ncbi:hypothetical protein CRUP_007058 [Coryphaenoides rupestris]|nr:hypothetical protein CRUP_007058 [Coryphaenoides rupestris]
MTTRVPPCSAHRAAFTWPQIRGCTLASMPPIPTLDLVPAPEPSHSLGHRDSLCSSMVLPPRGGLLVDVGSGPTLYQVLSGCEIFERLVLTDFLEVNRQELKRWLQDQGPGSLDWTPYLQHVCKLEGRGYQTQR